MIALGPLTGKRIAVLGLGKSGLVAARALKAAGAEVLAWDDAPAKRAELGFPATDLSALDWPGVASLVLSPGIPLTHPRPHPAADAARQAGVEIIGDIELFARSAQSARAVGITGTNGKSTTTALVGHVLTRCGVPAATGGNLGTPVLSFEPLPENGVYVLEMSSFQLDLTFSQGYAVAVLVNISPDHLDRHGGMDGYIAAKRRIFEAAETAVVGVDDEDSRALGDGLNCRVVRISGANRVPGGVYASGGTLYDDLDSTNRPILNLGQVPTLPGFHNAQNAAAAYATCRLLGLEGDAIAAAMRSFPGLAHRQERIAEIDGIAFVNDSKATNADSTARALVCYEAIYWIAGGVPKAGGVEPLKPLLEPVKHAFLIGQAANDFAATLDGLVPAEISGDLATAVRHAFQAAKADGLPGAVVLLSPACASYDQYTGFEARGDHFRALVQALDGAA